jgi:hypothetical protein
MDRRPRQKSGLPEGIPGARVVTLLMPLEGARTDGRGFEGREVRVSAKSRQVLVAPHGGREPGIE